MAHAQQQILDALQTLLASGGTVAGSRVFVDRVDPLQPADLPAIVILEEEEGESADLYMIEGTEQRTLSVAVHCILSASATAAADARAFGLAVEKLIAPSTAIKALCTLGHRINSSRQTNNGDGDVLLASRHQTWRFSYLVNPATPDTIL